MSDNLNTPIRLCRIFGMFQPETGSKFVATVYRACQGVFFLVVLLTSISMTVQLFITSNMDMMARTIDLWTVCLTGLYKWSYVVMFNYKFLEFQTLLESVHAQAIVAYGPKAHRFTANYLRRLRVICVAYVYSAFFVSISLTLSTINTSYSKRYHNEHNVKIRSDQTHA